MKAEESAEGRLATGSEPTGHMPVGERNETRGMDRVAGSAPQTDPVALDRTEPLSGASEQRSNAASAGQCAEVVQPVSEQSTNGMGTAGFVLALLGFLFSWVPFAGWILWLLGLIFSCIGMTRRPRGLAIAGLVISCVALVLLILLLGALGTLFAAYTASELL